MTETGHDIFVLCDIECHSDSDESDVKLLDLKIF